MRIASHAARPAPGAARRESPSAPTVASAQDTATGTSLIGETIIARTAGLVATSQPAAAPIALEPRRRPIRNVVHTSNPPVTGTETHNEEGGYEPTE